MTKTLLPLAEARAVATAIMDDLGPVCVRLEIAGSLRREKPAVGDLELVCIPRFEPTGLFGDQQQNAVWRHLTESPFYRFTKGNDATGRYFQVQHEGIQVDIFTAQPSSFGWLWLMRTGPAPFSHAVLTEWKRLKSLGRDQRGSVGGHLVDRYGTVFETPQEEDVFALIGCPFIPPQERTDDALQRVRAGR